MLRQVANIDKKTLNIVLCGVFAGITAVASQVVIPLPFSPIPINLALVSVFLSGGILGYKLGFASQLVYLMIGVFGVPVFAGFIGGPGRILGPTGGYLASYPFVSLAVGLIISKCKKSLVVNSISMVLGLLLCYSIGTIWFSFSTKTSIGASLSMCVYPFLLGDILKICFSSYVLKFVKFESFKC